MLGGVGVLFRKHLTRNLTYRTGWILTAVGLACILFFISIFYLSAIRQTIVVVFALSQILAVISVVGSLWLLKRLVADQKDKALVRRVIGSSHLQVVL